MGQRRRQRELEERMRQLDVLDELYGLGAMPVWLTPAPSVQRTRPAFDWRKPFVLTVAALVVAFLALTSLPAPGSQGAIPKAAPETSASPGHYTFIKLEPGTTTPVRWSRCQPIHYVINDAGAPSNGVPIVQSAVAEAAAASGLRFVFDGMSNRTPLWHTGTSPQDLPENAPVLIAWDTSDGDPQLKGDVAGIGGADAWSISGVDYYTTGGATLDASEFNSLASRRGGPQQERAIVLHELGHVLGLDHVQDRSQIMYPTAEGQLDYGSGDRNGLAILGQGPCG